MSTKATKKTAPADTEVPEEEAKEVEILDDELERLVPEPGASLELEDGTLVTTKPLKLKELFAALKIITRGSAMSLGAINLGLLQDSSDQFADTLVALLINAFPEADIEVAEFLRIVVDPVAPEGGWADRADALEAENHLDDLLLGNPDIGDAITILSSVIYTESRDLQKLGKKIGNAVKMFAKVTPQTKKN